VLAVGGAGSDVTADVGGLDDGVVGAGVLDWTVGGGAVVACPLDPTGAAGGGAVGGWLADKAGDEPLANGAI
jgi:hypothetical protein